MTDPQTLLPLAEAAAREAGDLLLHQRPADLGVEAKSTATDLVTEMDRAAERLLTERILTARPDDAVLGEEGTATISSDAPVRWILDPLDGTTNYVYGWPLWCVSVAAEVGDVVVAAVVHVPALGETFTATRRGGAFLNGEPITARPGVDLSQALVGTGFAYLSDRRAVQGNAAARLLPRVRDLRRGGSAAIDLCFVACGRLDAYYERYVNLWDVAAGGLIAAEAGARVSGVDRHTAGRGVTMAAGRPLYVALQAEVASGPP